MDKATIVLALMLCTVVATTTSKKPALIETGSRIISGRSVLPGQLPYQALIRSSKGTSCGGSILDSRWIITAAHCVDRYSAHWAMVGSVMFDEGAKYRMSVAVVHPYYNDRTLDHDIALMKTIAPIVFGAYVQAISLPSQIFPVGGNLILSGWGTTEHGSTRILQMTSARSQYSGSCGIVPQFKMCTRAYNHGGVCFGDSGGPMASVSSTTQGTQYTLQGVTSSVFSETCAKGLPNLATRVSYYVSWIRNVQWQNSQ